MIEWHPIETAPDDGTRVLVCDGKAVWISSQQTERHHAGDGMPLYGHGWYIVGHTQPTHWMPLPPPSSHQLDAEWPDALERTLPPMEMSA